MDLERFGSVRPYKYVLIPDGIHSLRGLPVVGRFA